MSNLDKAIRREKSDNGSIECQVLGVDDWDFFDSLVSFFEKNYNASIDNKVDGINTRTYQMCVKQEYFILKHNEDIGNWLYSCDLSGDSELMNVAARDLENKLINIDWDASSKQTT